jgi:hypothetical protein
LISLLHVKIDEQPMVSGVRKLWKDRKVLKSLKEMCGTTKVSKKNKSPRAIRTIMYAR